MRGRQSLQVCFAPEVGVEAENAVPAFLKYLPKQCAWFCTTFTRVIWDHVKAKVLSIPFYEFRI